MIFIESPWFDAWRREHLEAFQDMQNTLLDEPLAGDLISGSAGSRKLRIPLSGRGKRGGARVIYYYWTAHRRVYLLYAFAKNAQADLTKAQLIRLGSTMREEYDDG